VVDRGIDPVTGRRRQQRRSGYRTRQAAEDALRKTIQQLTDGTFVERSDQTVDEYLTEWAFWSRSAEAGEGEDDQEL
jgi:hypothetical protein